MPRLPRNLPYYGNSRSRSPTGKCDLVVSASEVNEADPDCHEWDIKHSKYRSLYLKYHRRDRSDGIDIAKE